MLEHVDEYFGSENVLGFTIRLYFVLQTGNFSCDLAHLRGRGLQDFLHTQKLTLPVLPTWSLSIGVWNIGFFNVWDAGFSNDTDTALYVFWREKTCFVCSVFVFFNDISMLHGGLDYVCFLWPDRQY